ncbi:MAG: hypothetical protein LBS90_04905 [Oscillospiraceae bacterium]|jgi:hypothetical protein|nr:hypothetical protein [Oscillospiraceae bacterium]
MDYYERQARKNSIAGCVFLLVCYTAATVICAVKNLLFGEPLYLFFLLSGLSLGVALTIEASGRFDQNGTLGSRIKNWIAKSRIFSASAALTFVIKRLASVSGDRLWIRWLWVAAAFALGAVFWIATRRFRTHMKHPDS